MRSVIKKFALAALCGTVIGVASQGAQAATWDIVGGSALAPIDFPGYGTAPGVDNVINNSGAGFLAQVVDPSPGSPQVWIGGANLQAVFSNPTYSVQWAYVGSESDNVISFSATSVGPSLENNANNQCVGCTGPSPVQPLALLGSSNGLNTLTPFFQFHDTSTNAGTVTNGSNSAPGEQQPNFILAYATLVGTQWVLQTNPSDFVVIGYNDNGFRDDNHDDMIVIAHISDVPQENGFTPIPAALPLFGSVLGGGFLFRRLRNRKTKAKKA